MRKVLPLIPATLFIAAACNHSSPTSPPADASQTAVETRSPEPVTNERPAEPATVAADPAPAAQQPVSGKCPSDMVEISGTYCPDLKETCAEWMAADDHFRCKRFSASTCKGATVQKHYCIDAYEYPNKPGEAPKVMVLWGEAQKLCHDQGKRLCAADEWTFACQGPKWQPYPYGTERNSQACRIDLGGKEPRWADAAAQGYGRTPAPIKGQACVNFSKPSGEYSGCVSAFGVHDMTGNVDEWVSSDGSANGGSWLKGGWWGNLRNRCGTEATTTEHDKTYSGIQVGFRCCSEAK